LRTTERLREARTGAADPVAERGFFAQLHDLSVASADLAHNTARLAACEARVILRRVVARVGIFMAGLLVAAAGLMLVLGGVAAALESAGLPRWAAFLVVGAVTMGAGAVCALRSLRRLGDRDLAFDRTLAELSADIDRLRGTAGREQP
jgi:uncharacterized membrane protein YqjE